MDKLRHQSELAVTKLNEIKAAGEDFWEKMVVEMGKVRDAFTSSFHYFQSKFRVARWPVLYEMLVVSFDNENAADARNHALRKRRTEGDITRYAMALVARDANGHVSLKEAWFRMAKDSGQTDFSAQ